MSDPTLTFQEMYDLSRMRDRAQEIVVAARDLSLSKVGGRRDDDLRMAGEAVASQAETISEHYERRLGGPENYVPESDYATGTTQPDKDKRDVLVEFFNDQHHRPTADSVLNELHQNGWKVVPR